MTSHPKRNQGPWKMLTWANRDGTGAASVRRYTTRKNAVAAANRIRNRGVVALVEHENAQRPASHPNQ